MRKFSATYPKSKDYNKIRKICVGKTTLNTQSW